MVNALEIEETALGDKKFNSNCVYNILTHYNDKKIFSFISRKSFNWFYRWELSTSYLQIQPSTMKLYNGKITKDKEQTQYVLQCAEHDGKSILVVT